MASIFGRATVMTKTNKSGGALAKGDVVVIDTSNDNAVTTTTSAGTTAQVGVVVEENGIANNASGRVAFGGHVSLVNVNASVTRGHYGTTHTVAKQATGAGASRVVGSFCQFTTGGTTPEADLFTQPDASSATGDMATDALWDTAGDIAVGTGANTAARLAIGAAGGRLSRINGAVAWNAGTSFPTAAAGDIYHRTDLDEAEWRYNGTRWLCTTPHEIQWENVTGIGATQTYVTRRPAPLLNGGSDIWIEDYACRFNIGGGGSALSGSHKWVITVAKLAVTSGTITVIGTQNIDSGNSAEWRQNSVVNIDALMNNGTTHIMLLQAETKTGTPGALNCYTTLTYRHVAT